MCFVLVGLRAAILRLSVTLNGLTISIDDLSDGCCRFFAFTPHTEKLNQNCVR